MNNRSFEIKQKMEKEKKINKITFNSNIISEKIQQFYQFLMEL